MDILSIRNLTKSYGEKQVLRGMTLSVPEHSVFGFVGRNGAGKTTTMKAVLGLIKPDAGEILVDGEKVVYGQTATNRFIGYLPDVPEYYGFMTAQEYLQLCGDCMGMDRQDCRKRSGMLLEQVGLAAERHRIRGFSRGMKQRLGIAQALLACPKLLICDEPASALDPLGRKEILDILHSVRGQTTVLFSTHILSDVERICTDAAFLHNGEIAVQGKVSALKEAHHVEAFVIQTADEEGIRRLLAGFKDARQTQPDTLLFPGGDGQWFSVLAFIAEHRIAVRRIEQAEPSLETLFLEVTAT